MIDAYHHSMIPIGLTYMCNVRKKRHNVSHYMCILYEENKIDFLTKNTLGFIQSMFLYSYKLFSIPMTTSSDSS